MSRQFISLKTRVRYEGRVRTFDRRAPHDADLEKLPDPLWYKVTQVLRSKFPQPLPGQAAAKGTDSAKP